MNPQSTPAATSIQTDLEAFCPTCPPVEEVTARLAQFGFRLVFSLPAQRSQGSLPELPAQYHYRDGQGSEVIYLAGRDSPLHTGELSLPFHESRFWLSRGASGAAAFELIRLGLARHWRLQWQQGEESRAGDGEGDNVQEEVA